MLDRLTADEPLVDRFVYLVGRPPLKDFTGFVTEQGVNGQDAVRTFSALITRNVSW